MAMIRRRTAKKITRPKKTYTIDNKTYNSKALVEYHRELMECKKNGTIKSFELPEADEVSRSKFHAYKATINGISFDSLNESRFYIKLLRDKTAGFIKDFELQKPFEICPAFRNSAGKKIRKAEYLADFVLYLPDNTTRVIDVKGVETDVFKLKKKLVEHLYPVTIECWHWIAGRWMGPEEYKAYRKSKKVKK